MWAMIRTWNLGEGFCRSDLVSAIRLLGKNNNEHCTTLLEGKEKVDNRSYVGFGEGWVIRPKTESGFADDPLLRLREFVKTWQNNLQCLVYESTADSSEPQWVETKAKILQSGIIGYLDYEWGLCWFRPSSAQGLNPSYFFRLCPVNIVILPQQGQLVLEVFAEDQTKAKTRFLSWVKALESLPEIGDNSPSLPRYADNNPSISPHHTEVPVMGANSGWQSNMSKADFMNSVRRIQDYIKAGDIFQAVFSQKFYRQAEVDPWQLYERLGKVNPSPYMFYIEGARETLIGSSPELLVATQGKKVITKPIAGTRKRGRNEEEDRALELDLRQDAKENAEHVMLVDLGRNDLGRVSRYGSVKVAQYAQIQRFSHVMHLVSEIEGELKPDHDGLDALKAVFPAGTLSGAPKVRAMEILKELEPTARGAYGGALGIVRFNGDVDFCITIRTLQVKDKEVSIQAGAGIVFDSNPEKEYEETINKAKALIKVVEGHVSSDR